MRATKQLISMLEGLPSIHPTCDEDSVTVTPSNGFAVQLIDNGDESIVAYDGWHDHFERTEDAINWFFFGLCNRCRLKVFRRGKIEYKWIVQTNHDEIWIDSNITGLLIFPFWRAKTIEYRQNNLLSASEFEQLTLN